MDLAPLNHTTSLPLDPFSAPYLDSTRLSLPHTLALYFSGSGGMPIEFPVNTMAIFPTYHISTLGAVSLTLAPRYLQGLKIDHGPHNPPRRHPSATKKSTAPPFSHPRHGSQPIGRKPDCYRVHERMNARYINPWVPPADHRIGF